MGEVHCFACGLPGHLRAECPKSARTPRTEAPVPAPADAGPAVREKDPALIRRPESEISSDYHGWAEKARAALEARGCIVNTAEARERRLRRMAAEQVAESRRSTITERSGKSCPN